LINCASRGITSRICIRGLPDNCGYPRSTGLRRGAPRHGRSAGDEPKIVRMTEAAGPIDRTGRFRARPAA
jgi:hypothetical protein